MSGLPTADERSSYTCKWRTTADTKPSDSGEIVVKARNLVDAIGAAKSKIHAHTGLGIKEIVVYEVEEPFL